MVPSGSRMTWWRFPIVRFTSLSECFSERVGIEPCALEVAGEDVAVVDEQHG